MVINEQIRRYNEKMEEIEQLEYAEALAVNQLKLKRQNTVRHQTLPRSKWPLFRFSVVSIPWQKHPRFRLLFSLVPGCKGEKCYHIKSHLSIMSYDIIHSQALLVSNIYNIIK